MDDMRNSIQNDIDVISDNNRKLFDRFIERSEKSEKEFKELSAKVSEHSNSIESNFARFKSSLERVKQVDHKIEAHKNDTFD